MLFHANENQKKAGVTMLIQKIIAFKVKTFIRERSMCAQLLSPVGLFVTRVLHPRDFSCKNTGMGCHFSPPDDLPDPGIESMSLVSPALAGGFFTTAVAEKSTRKGETLYNDQGINPRRYNKN